ncbi:4-hydroxy-3-methylbut-2-enyl diphosphate reductase [Candidatus Woesearchaeota archaeon]|nr:4-hydroxy-3-methylbut-2-enyl diphosphate reductase [Candidatus Woesearchaeota archaeon]
MEYLLILKQEHWISSKACLLCRIIFRILSRLSKSITLPNKMEIILAKNKGMCFGVRRALDLAFKAAGPGRIYTYGPLVHNKDVVKDLEDKGISITELDDIKQGDLIIIRAHGVSDKELDAIKKKGAEVIDATCPFVSKVKKDAKEMQEKGFRVVMLGQKDHPEIRGIAESLRDPIIISSTEDAREMKQEIKDKRIGFVSQTTQSEKSFNGVLEVLKDVCAEVDVSNTICNATSERQESAKRTASESDIMLVVGDKRSANTNKLAELCSEITETRHIENVSELRPEWFKGMKTAGITAGASTPDWIVDEVVDRLKQIQQI